MTAIALYRHFDIEGQLLYVGISNSVFTRTSTHIAVADWAECIDHIKIERHADRQSAAKAEAIAVVSEKPLFNKMFATTETGSQITDLINQWPTRKELALDVGASNVAVHRWAKRNSLPAEWQQAVIEAAQARGMTWVTAAWLVAAQARRSSGGDAA